MVKSYCVKQNKRTECVEPSGCKTAKNGRLMFWCTCAECGIKTRWSVARAFAPTPLKTESFRP